jgi:mannose-1-phosphate guanylyltransferase
MAGGSSSRIWSLARQQFPKQFLTLLGGFNVANYSAAFKGHRACASVGCL